MFLLLVAVGLIGGVLAATQRPNLDNSWLLIATGRVMDGAVIGRDLFETNPPLIYWLMEPAVAATRWLGTDYYLTYCLWVGLLSAVSAWLLFRVLVLAEIPPRRAAAAAAAALLLFVLVCGPAYGQRDPLAYLLAIPFIATEAFRAAGRRMPPAFSLLIALVAAVGFLIKPYLALVPAVLFVWRLWRERSVFAVLAADAVAMLAIAVAYVAYILLVTPAYLDLTRLMVAAYPAYDSGGWKLLLSFVPAAVIIAGLWLAAARSAAPAALAVRVLLVAAIVFFLGAMSQLKGWYYHLLPGNLTLCITCVVFLAMRPAARPVGRPLAYWAVLAVLALFTVGGVARASYFGRGTVAHSELAGIIRQGDGGPFLAISSSMTGVFPDVNEMHVPWASQSPMQWMVPAIVGLSKGSPAQRRQAEELRAISTRLVVGDLTQWQPRIVAVKTATDQGMIAPFDWIHFYSQDRVFAGIWSGYCAAGRTADWDIYRRCGS